ncbi:hypothetical protein Syun_027331 [Stephania yunnanensis]|uniref:Uncharacterized protein n=1 Tax=Stephania yunnanensis TaxID=152371 RepID=A0AAP0EHR2_9MAGN
MGFEGGLGWLNHYSKKHCRSLLWKVRAALKKIDHKSHLSKHKQHRFQYDPSSYALNFDDGCCDLRGRGQEFKQTQQTQNSNPITDSKWIFIILVKPN